MTQKPGVAGCVSQTGSGGVCADGSALNGAFSVAVSPDGASVYVASVSSDAVAVFNRNQLTGGLTQKPGTAGCVSETGSGGLCTDGEGLAVAFSVAVSPDGASVYVASGDLADFAPRGAVAVFNRNPTSGTLTQKPGTAGCISETGSGGLCADGKALVGPRSITVSSDGASVYVASVYGDAVAVFERDPQSGTLTQKAGTAGCVSETGSGGHCTDGKELDGALSVTVSADGSSVYLASLFGDAIAIFHRDPSTGRLIQKPGLAGCVSQTGSGGLCRDGRALDGPGSVVVSPDDASVYVASSASLSGTGGGVAVFDRNASTGRLNQKPGLAGCVSETRNGGACGVGAGLVGANAVTVSPDGASVYVGSFFSVAIFDRITTTG